MLNKFIALLLAALFIAPAVHAADFIAPEKGSIVATDDEHHDDEGHGDEHDDEGDDH